MILCLFCNQPDKSYKPDVDFICSNCVMLLAGADQEDLKRAYQKALDGGFHQKVAALQSFIIPEEKHGKRPVKSVKRNFNRKRVVRTFRHEKVVPRISAPE